MAEDNIKRPLGLRNCDVYGCPRQAHIYTGAANCRYHYNKAGKNLGHITMMLNNHAAEVDWYEKLLTATTVDFPQVKHDAHPNMPVLAGEELPAYKKRMAAYIEELLSGKELPLPTQHWSNHESEIYP